MQYFQNKPLVCLSAGANPTFFVILRHSRRISINKFTPPDFSGGVLTCFILSGTQNRIQAYFNIKKCGPISNSARYGHLSTSSCHNISINKCFLYCSFIFSVGLVRGLYFLLFNFIDFLQLKKCVQKRTHRKSVSPLLLHK